MLVHKEIVARLASEFAVRSVIERLQSLRNQLEGRLVFTTSLGLEDQVITHCIAESSVEIEIVTLDTGRLFPQSHDVWAQTQLRYNISIQGYHPDHALLEQMVRHDGINGFYQSVKKRQACCHVRKMEPLDRALKGASGWVTGLRADASGNRSEMAPVEYDAARDLIKYNPLFYWTREQAADFVATNNIPVNTLHAEGFASIGCAPCTRAIGAGEPERSGRWWWEQGDSRECGLHTDASGKLVRAKA